MKYFLNINQEKAIELQLNVSEAILLEILINAVEWATIIYLDGEIYYWVARQKIKKEAPILNIKEDTIYRKLKKLDKKGLVKYKKFDKKDCFLITELGKKYTSDKSEKNPRKFEKNSEINTEKTTTDTNTKIHTITNNTLSREKESFQNFKKRIIQTHAGYPIISGIYFGYRKDVTFSLTKSGFLRNDFNNTVLSSKTHFDLISRVWEFMYEHPSKIFQISKKDNKNG